MYWNVIKHQLMCIPSLYNVRFEFENCIPHDCDECIFKSDCTIKDSDVLNIMFSVKSECASSDHCVAIPESAFIREYAPEQIVVRMVKEYVKDIITKRLEED